ncbi:MAG TPA: SIS domain-containing protein [Acidimicrobiales bacterium]|nr:SIS domain-containing protein [Acidimicrobiales bacterium]
MPISLDSVGMWDAAAGLPEQVADASSSFAIERADALPNHDEIENVVVLGMGGSGIAGDVLIAAAGPFMAVPAVVLKSYTLPAFVNDNSLVIAVSYSGNTEETVEAAAEAAAAGARLCVVSGDGELRNIAEASGSPYVPVLPGYEMPRAAIGAVAVPPLLVLEAVGLFPGAAQWIDNAVAQLRRRRDQLVGDKSPARELALTIGGTLPLVHSSGGLGTAAVTRWRCEINENAKAPAISSVQPELCHNEIVGWGQHGDITRQLLTLVQLRHDHEHPQVARRFDLVEEIMREVMAGIETVQAEGEGELAQLFDLMIFGTFVSLHMADRMGIDPGPIPIMDTLKAQLAAAR